MQTLEYRGQKILWNPYTNSYQLQLNNTVHTFRSLKEVNTFLDKTVQNNNSCIETRSALQ